MLVAKLFFSLPYYEIKPLHIFTSQGSTSIGFPDYSSPTKISFPYISVENGWILLNTFTPNGAWYISLNNGSFYELINSSYGSSSIMFPISKGDSVKLYHYNFSGNGTIRAAVFYPCK